MIPYLGFRESAVMAEGQPRAVAPVDCKECSRQFPTFKVYIKHLLAKECGAAQSQRPSIKVIICLLQCFEDLSDYRQTRMFVCLLARARLRKLLPLRKLASSVENSARSLFSRKIGFQVFEGNCVAGIQRSRQPQFQLP